MSVIQSWNKGAERLFGYLAEEVIGKTITILIPPERQGEERTIPERTGAVTASIIMKPFAGIGMESFSMFH